MSEKNHKILIVKLCCIGDVIFMTPVVQAVREAFPNAHIGFLASTWIKDIVERIPFLDEVIYYDAPVHRKGILSAISETISIIRTLRTKKYDIAVFGHRNSLFPLVAFIGGIKQRIGFTGTKFLTNSITFDDKLHEIDRYLSIIKLIKIDYNRTTTNLSVHESDVSNAENICRILGFNEANKYVGIFPGGGENPGTTMPIKRWYPERYAELCGKFFKEINYLPLFLGNNNDKIVIEKILPLLPKGIKAVDASGMTGLGELCGLLKRCQVVIGADTGPMHMAAALGVPTVMLFGPSDPRLVAPRNKLCRYIWKGVKCSPCYTPLSVMNKKNIKGKEFICWTGTHECLRELQVDDVMKVFLEVIEEIKLQQAESE